MNKKSYVVLEVSRTNYNGRATVQSANCKLKIYGIVSINNHSFHSGTPLDKKGFVLSQQPTTEVHMEYF